MAPKHREVHPTDVDGCFGCKLLSVNIAPSATPSRNGGAEAARINATEKEWAKDMRSYRAMRQQGLKPPHIDGAHRLEGAKDQFEIDTGHLLNDSQRKQAREGLDRAREITNA